MKLVRKGHRHTHRGIIGIESAIVMIAFVIVAAALAFVVLNMGFATTQKAKTSITSSLGEASSSLEISGKVTGIGDIGASSVLNVTAVPIKIAAGGDSINLANSSATIKYLSNTVEYDNIYRGFLTGSHTNITNAFDAATAQGISQFGAANSNPVDEAGPTTTSAIIYWTVNVNNNSILDQGEHAVIAIAYSDVDRPGALDKLRAELIGPTGASLTMERQVPNLSNLVTDLG